MTEIRLFYVEVNLKSRILIKSGYHIVPSSFTDLVNIKEWEKVGNFHFRRKMQRKNKYADVLGFIMYSLDTNSAGLLYYTCSMCTPTYKCTFIIK